MKHVYRITAVLTIISLSVWYTWPSTVFADDIAQGNNYVDTGNITVDAGSGTNRFLVATIYVNGGASVTAADFNGDAMTSVQSTSHGLGGGGELEIWVLPNPDAGSHTLSFTISGSPTNTLTGAAVYTGVKQTTTMESVNGGTGTNPSADLTTSTDNSWGFGVCVGNTSTNIGGDITELNTNTATLKNIIGDTNAAVSPAGTVSVSCNNGGTGTIVIASAAFAPAAAASSGNTMLMGMNF